MEELQGQILAGRFKLHELIGEGGYGAVFRAEQLSVKRACAVKVIKTNADMRHDNVVERFRAEAVATSSLHHPNTVVIYDFGEDEDSQMLFLAMEYLDGYSLYHLLEERGALELETALHIANQMAASLQDAHERRIIHRDIKPHNVMLMERGGELFAKVIDFGIARVIMEANTTTMERMTADDTMVGTPYYMAPEQIRDQRVDGRTDMYALAICLYRMLTGRTPFQGGSGIIVASQHLTDRPLPLSAYKPDLDVPREFERVLLKALEKNMDERYTSIAQFAEALNHASGLDVSRSMTGGVRIGQRSGKFVPMSAAPRHTPTPDIATTPISDEVRLSIKEDAVFGETIEASSEEVLRAQLQNQWGDQADAPQRSTFMMYPVNVGPDESTARDPGPMALAPNIQQGQPAQRIAQQERATPATQVRPETERLPLDERPGSTLAVPASQVQALGAALKPSAPAPAVPPQVAQNVAPTQQPTPAQPSTETVSTALEQSSTSKDASTRKTMLIAGMAAAGSFLVVAIIMAAIFKKDAQDPTPAQPSELTKQDTTPAPTDEPTKEVTPPSDPAPNKVNKDASPPVNPAFIAGVTLANVEMGKAVSKAEKDAKIEAERVEQRIRPPVDNGKYCVSDPTGRKCKAFCRSNSSDARCPDPPNPPSDKTVIINVGVTIMPAGYAKITAGGKKVYSGADGSVELESGKKYSFEILTAAFGDSVNKGTFTVSDDSKRIILPREKGARVVVR